MGVILESIVGASILGLIIVGPLLAYRIAVVPALERRGARWTAYTLTAAPAAITVVLGAWFIAAIVADLRFPSALLVFAAFWGTVVWDSLVDPAIRVSGMSPRAHPSGAAGSPAVSSADRRAHRWVSLATVVIFVGSAAPIAADQIAIRWSCIQVDVMLLTAAEVRPSAAPPLRDAILAEPEPGAVLAVEQSLDLESAAASRHDPDARTHLLKSSFEAGVIRRWVAADGRLIDADIFEFADSTGAQRYQEAVNRYACQFANVAYRGPRQGIGMQVRRATGDPIEEQISWVSGSRRYRVSVRHVDLPPDHTRILDIAVRAVVRAEGR